MYCFAWHVKDDCGQPLYDTESEGGLGVSDSDTWLLILAGAVAAVIGMKLVKKRRATPPLEEAA